MGEGSPEDTDPTKDTPEGEGFHRTWWSGPGRSLAGFGGVQSCLGFLRGGGVFSSFQGCQLFAPKQAADQTELPHFSSFWAPETLGPGRGQHVYSHCQLSAVLFFPWRAVFFQETVWPWGQRGGECDQMALCLLLCKAPMTHLLELWARNRDCTYWTPCLQ
jgi:hypothetical protein